MKLFYVCCICITLNISVECLTRIIRKLGDESNFASSTTSTSSSCPVPEVGPTYHNGATMKGTVGLFNIFVGKSFNDYKIPYLNNKATSTAGIIENFASTFSESTYAKIHATYNSATKFTYNGTYFYNVPNSWTTLQDIDVDLIIQQSIQNAGWKTSTNSIYNFIFRGDLTYSATRIGGLQWNNYWCGYHIQLTTIPSLNKVPITIIGDESFVSDTSLQPGCMLQYASQSSVKYVSDVHPAAFTPPNGNKYADAIVSVYAHEVAEAVTDPYGDAWYRGCDGEENADICKWTFATIYQSPDGSHYNVQQGPYKFLIQANWVIKAPPGVSGCVVDPNVKPISSYPTYSVDASPVDNVSYLFTIGYAIGALTVFLIIVIILRHFIWIPRQQKKQLEKSFEAYVSHHFPEGLPPGHPLLKTRQQIKNGTYKAPTQPKTPPAISLAPPSLPATTKPPADLSQEEPFSVSNVLPSSPELSTQYTTSVYTAPVVMATRLSLNGSKQSNDADNMDEGFIVSDVYSSNNSEIVNPNFNNMQPQFESSKHLV